MTNTQELYYLKSFYLHRANQKEIEFTVELCDSISELTDIHIYERIAKRQLYENSQNFDVNHNLQIDDILTAIIISDFDMRNANTEHIEEFINMCNLECYDLNYDTIDYRLTQIK